MKLKFGKYKDEDICDVPIEYLKWLEEQSWLKEQARKEIQHEIERREGDRSSLGFEKDSR